MNAADSESTAIQQEILFALRSGAEFRTAHKEGGTIIRWQHGRFIREDYGDWNEHAEYTDEAAFLAFLWRFFEWEGRGFQRLELPDAARWENIRQLLHGGSSGIGTHRRVLVNELSRAWKIGAFVIAAAAVALVVWLRGGIHWRTGARPEPAPQKLDTFDGRPPQVTQPAFKLPKPGVPRP